MQREKHFRCPECHKKMGTTRSLIVHCLNVHKRQLTAVPAALEGRDDPSWDIFGMAGVPEGMGPHDPPPAPPSKANGAGAAAPGATAAVPGAPGMPPLAGGPPMAGMPPPGMPPYGMPPPGYAPP